MPAFQPAATKPSALLHSTAHVAGVPLQVERPTNDQTLARVPHAPDPDALRGRPFSLVRASLSVPPKTGMLLATRGRPHYVRLNARPLRH
ncbi:hypothetical protein FOMPIDRAFT_1047912 [Fomitopsis schrenkii]|uniref:Uncharacterized protein n=1 Tax=Fomitopsis schrenkii TaxID=2126942 RepID=S8FWE0_FOMSC|nr:hypothetical protein FOMPIDRAFT_1047912 [Fomitopsis schrenkii]